MPSSLATALLTGLLLFSGQAEGRNAPAGESFSVAAKKQVKKKKKAKKKRKNKKIFASTGIPAADKILEMNIAMLEITKKNLNDCWKLVKALEAWGKKNYADHKELAKQREEAIAKMSPEEHAEYVKKTNEAMYQIAKKYWDVLDGVDKKCPSYKTDIEITMGVFK